MQDLKEQIKKHHVPFVVASAIACLALAPISKIASQVAIIVCLAGNMAFMYWRQQDD